MQLDMRKVLGKYLQAAMQKNRESCHLKLFELLILLLRYTYELYEITVQHCDRLMSNEMGPVK